MRAFMVIPPDKLFAAKAAPVSYTHLVTESLCRWADCILLDVMMPGEDGFATCRRIRAITQAPILFLTARTDEQSVLTLSLIHI